MEAIILAGGFGTRLRSVVSDVPKPMAPMDEKATPFLQVLIDNLIKYDFGHIILSTGYKSDIVESYFGDEYKGVKLSYSVEKEPLFTGGAIKKSLLSCQKDNVVVLNGDTFFDVDLRNMMDVHVREHSDLTIAVKQLEDFSRYGTIQFDNKGRVSAFVEKKACKSGWINGGVYIVKRKLLDSVEQKRFSFEKDFMEKYISELFLYTYKSEGYFIDIGIPEDYMKARECYQNNRSLG